jgi:hypothetical protein
MPETRSDIYIVAKAILWMLAGVAVTVYIVLRGISVYQVMRAGAQAPARVISTSDDVREADDGRRAGVVTIAEYEFLANGKRFRGTTEGPQGAWSKGDELMVEFNPSNPNQNRAIGDRQVLGDYFLLLLVGGLFAFYAIWINVGTLQRLYHARGREE